MASEPLDAVVAPCLLARCLCHILVFLTVLHTVH